MTHLECACCAQGIGEQGGRGIGDIVRPLTPVLGPVTRGIRHSRRHEILAPGGVSSGVPGGVAWEWYDWVFAGVIIGIGLGAVATIAGMMWP